MANIDLDIDLNGLENDILNKSNSSRPDVYPRVVRYASSKGVSRRQVDKIMLEVAGGYSSLTDEELKKEAEANCKKANPNATQLESENCISKYIEDAKAKELKKSKNTNFWNNVIKGVNTIGGYAKEYSTTKSGQNLKEWEQDKNNNDNLPPKTETRILGMNPLVFTVVALGTVTTLAIVTVLLMRKGKK